MVRFCPKPGCGEHVRAESSDASRLVCAKCGTEICFKCRDYWHGSEVTCDEAMNKQLLGWAEKNKANVSFCPVCRTRIEKNRGCNHMTCGYCKYEFCWACGASATAEEKHFQGNGCGVKMMDENVRPGDHLKITNTSKCCRMTCIILQWVLCIIFFLPIVFFAYMLKSNEAINRNLRNTGCIARVIFHIFWFIVALVACIILAVCTTFAFYVYLLLRLLQLIGYCLICGCLWMDSGPRRRFNADG